MKLSIIYNITLQVFDYTSSIHTSYISSKLLLIIPFKVELFRIASISSIRLLDSLRDLSKSSRKLRSANEFGTKICLLIIDDIYWLLLTLSIFVIDWVEWLYFRLDPMRNLVDWMRVDPMWRPNPSIIKF